VSISGENLASHIEKMHAAKVKEKQIELKTSLESAFVFYGDETLMIQVLNNLVGNAVKFTPENGQITLHFNHRNGKK
jgi:signal transduction histidine kinase